MAAAAAVATADANAATAAAAAAVVSAFVAATILLLLVRSLLSVAAEGVGTGEPQRGQGKEGDAGKQEVVRLQQRLHVGEAKIEDVR